MNKPVINVPGCPPIADVMMAVVTHVLVLGQIPALDNLGRPKEFYGRRVHDTCYRRPNYDAGLFVESFDDENARKGYCLYKMGCKGPVTYNACSVVGWNEGTSSPIRSGHGCIGCSEEGFWDNGPLYQHLASSRASASRALQTRWAPSLQRQRWPELRHTPWSQMCASTKSSRKYTQKKRRSHKRP